MTQILQVLLTDAPAFLDCRVEARWDTGDRTVYLAEVADGAVMCAAWSFTGHLGNSSLPPAREGADSGRAPAPKGAG